MVRIAIVEKDKCHPLECPGTYYCLRVCPNNRMGKECMVKSEDGKIEIDEELSNDGCKICEKACPFGAIHIINLPERKDYPIFRYAKNAFELFSLPVSKKGKVIGILGRNGIGKSTALEILTNTFKPNFGKFDETVDEKEIVTYFKGSILGDYLKDLYSNKIKISYKPQRIELIPQLYSGTVFDLIEKVDKKNLGLQLLKELDIEHLKDRNIKDLSGGELQKVAIIAASVKDADVIYFDEPASFLDIVSRIKVANLIRKLAENTSIVLVEHDLATLDYVSDEIVIVYGERACYGIFSQSKSVRNGINEYLDGYLDNENMRFRDYKIKFFPPEEKTKYTKDILLEYPDLEKNYDSFSLKVVSGTIHKKEILGIMGANGLGKSTFLKILSGIEKPSKGKISKYNVVYKEQYPKAIEGKVQDLLMKAAGPLYASGWYKHNILEKLGLQYLLDHDVKYLSGGELQKFHIALTISKEADIYAFDEPSAFIDVEDRLNVAHVIKDFIEVYEKCAIVVDHDVQFIDYIADSMLVFEGSSGKKGTVYGPVEKKEGMNRVLKDLGITYRRDKTTNRPRINKPGSQLDQKQKSSGDYYAYG
ncbi:MAG TPA: ribosome biogenesis/translation initiation ATPase RLI [Candidatus Nanoarchaeia archaeon]|nr:ribosome biogenesis/translation initiation ATPase RLI [Candidatus Nanoarchaeia archaeon]